MHDRHSSNAHSTDAADEVVQAANERAALLGSVLVGVGAKGDASLERLLLGLLSCLDAAIDQVGVGVVWCGCGGICRITRSY